MGQVIGGLLGGQGGRNPLLQTVTRLLGNNSNLGGLAGLVQVFQKNGLSEIVNLWVSTGQNMPATPQRIEQGLGSDLLNQLASKAGLSPQDASAQLSIRPSSKPSRQTHSERQDRGRSIRAAYQAGSWKIASRSHVSRWSGQIMTIGTSGLVVY